MSDPTRLAKSFGPVAASNAFWRWFDARLNDAADGFCAISEKLRPLRRVLFVEQSDGTLASPLGSCRIESGRLIFVQGDPRRSLKGAEVELRLAPSRCVFREVELPARAGEFLEGVVRAQIDRLTPWRANEAAFGWSAPETVGPDRIRVTVAATRREPIAGLLDIGADNVAIMAARADGSAPIALLSQQAGAVTRRRRWRLVLGAALGLSLLAALAALVTDWTLGAALRDETDSLTANLAARRAAILRREHAADDPASQALDALKRSTPSAVVALEALSRAIPDDAYLQEMRLQGDKVEIAGLATDAAALIKHIEQSSHFSRATFTAPTTRSAGDRESFRIEARVASINVISP